MLKTVRLASVSYKKSVWNDFATVLALSNPQWIVSDLKTKIFLNRLLLQEREIIFGAPIKRAAELWTDLLRATHPDMVPVGSLGAWALAQKFLDEAQLGEWSKRPGAAQSLLKFCAQAASLVTHETVEDILQEFKEKFPKQALIFPFMVEAGFQFFRFCIEARRIPKIFIPSLILQNPQALPEKQKYFFDLGSEILETEKLLIEELGRKNEVVLIEAEWVGDFDPSHLEVWRCSSPDAEARKAVEKVAQWVSEGVALEEICISAPDLSLFENILEHDLKWQGIGLQKELSSPVAGLRFFRELSAQLRILSGSWTATDLFEAFPQIKTEEKRFLKPAQEIDQIVVPDVYEKVRGLLSLGNIKNNEMGFSQFEGLIFKLVGEMKSVPLSLCVKVLTKIKADLDFKINGKQATWPLHFFVDLWQKACAQTDHKYKASDSSGVWAVDFHSIEEIPAKRFIILGAQSAKAASDVTAELSPEVFAFFLQAGFIFQRPFGDWTKQIPWFLEFGKKTAVLSCALNDQSGQSLTPSPLWLHLAKAKNKNLDVIDSARELNWTAIQNHIKEFSSTLDKIKEWDSGRASRLYESVTSETRETKAVNIKLPEIKLSPSTIESLWQCGFKVFASHGLGLRDDADLEVDPSPSMRGEILHSAVEAIIKSGLALWDQEKIQNLVDQLGEKQKKAASDIWPSARGRMVRQLLRFVEYEKKWREITPIQFKSLVEVEFEGQIQWNSDGQTLDFLKRSEQSDGASWPFRGRIDRLDLDTQGNGVLLDYKDRNANLLNIGSWLSQGQFQLALYAQALKAGMIKSDDEFEIQDVVGAFYYSLRNSIRNRGFGKQSLLLGEHISKTALVDDGELKTQFQKINQEVGLSLEKIMKGNFTPIPREEKAEKICKTCAWKRLCRSHQLL